MFRFCILDQIPCFDLPAYAMHKAVAQLFLPFATLPFIIVDILSARHFRSSAEEGRR